MVVTDNSESQTQSMTPQSVTTPTSTSSPHKVQKRSKRQSNVQTAPSTMERGLESLPQDPDGVDHDSKVGDAALDSYHHPQYDIPNISPPVNQNNKVSAVAAQKQSPLSVSQVPNISAVPRVSQGGCCSNKPRDEPAPAPPNSCCGNENKKPPSTGAPANATGIHHHYMPSLTATDTLRTSEYPEHSPIGTSGYNPITQHYEPNPTQNYNKHVLSGIALPNSLPHITTNFLPPKAGHQHSPFEQQYANQSLPSGQANSFPQASCNESTNSEHVCECGDGCQCLGCASHPFNETTRQHIQEMGYLMALRDEDQSREQSEDGRTSSPDEQATPTNVQFHSYPNTNITFHTDHGVIHDAPTEQLSHFVGGGSHSLPATYVPNHDMTMQPNAYYTVEYPVGFLDPCSNLLGTCQCGSNCQCVGCLTHGGHNGIPLESSPPPDELESNIANSASRSTLTNHISNPYSQPMFSGPDQGPISSRLV